MTEKRVKILIAEDDEVSRRILVRLVDSLGYIAIEASTGLRAMNILEDNRDISLLITDMMMPEIDGRELVQKIRNSKTLSKLPILMVSAVVPLRDILGILDLGVSRFAPKPVNIKEVTEYIEILLSSSPNQELEVPHDKNTDN